METPRAKDLSKGRSDFQTTCVKNKHLWKNKYTQIWDVLDEDKSLLVHKFWFLGYLARIFVLCCQADIFMQMIAF